MTDMIDYDLHGLAAIRLVDATAADAAVVQRQLGLRPTQRGREPDLVVRFVDKLSTRPPTRLLGLDDAAFTDDAFLVLQGRFNSRARVQIPFQQIGKGCEIVCERGLARVPLLIPILNLTVLANGAVPLHASAFCFDGIGVLATGWSKGGKTETLPAFMAGGAQYIGDEWVYLSADGRSMYGIPEPIRIWSWHLDSLPRYRRLVRRTDRARMRLLSLVVGGMGRATANGGRHRSAATRTINRMAPLLRKQMGVDVSPHRLFGADSCLPSGTDFMILPGPILGRPAVACLQTYIEGEKRDALRGLSDNELVTALGASNGLRRQILAFAEQTRRTYRPQGRCADFLGENNLTLVRNGDRWSLHLIDYGVFDTDRMRRTPALSERIEGCIGRIESLAQKASASGSNCVGKWCQKLRRRSPRWS